MTAVGFEPTHPKIVELESTALDHSAKLSVPGAGRNPQTAEGLEDQLLPVGNDAAIAYAAE